MTIRLENVGIVVEDLEAVAAFFASIGLTVVGRDTVQGDWVDRCVGLEGVRCDVVVMQTPDGHGELEIMRFQSPAVQAGDPSAPPNTMGIRRIAFSVDDLDAALTTVREQGIKLIGEVVQYQDIYRLCYLRGPEGIILMLAQKLK